MLFVKDVINQGGGGFAKRLFSNNAYLVEVMTGGGGEGSQKSQKIDDIFYERPLNESRFM